MVSGEREVLAMFTGTHKAANKRGRVRDLTGQVFGYLTVVKRTGKPDSAKNKHRQAYWLCLCSCGKEKITASWQLISGGTSSCGCKRVDAAIERVNRTPPKPKDPVRALRRRVMRIYCTIRLKCQKQGIPFEIKFEDLPPVPPTCPVLGIPLRHGNKGHDPNSPSLDRFIPSLGYTKNNIAWISNRANLIKTNASVDEVEMLAVWMRKVTDGNTPYR